MKHERKRMKKVTTALAEGLAKLVEVKSIVTIAMTAAMVALLFRTDAISGELLSLFSSAYGSVITYFFTRKTQ